MKEEIIDKTRHGRAQCPEAGKKRESHVYLWGRKKDTSLAENVGNFAAREMKTLGVHAW